MNNKELVTELSRRLGKTQKQVQAMLDITTEALVSTLQAETTVSVQGFGSFEVRKKLDRVLINPTTKQKMVVPPKLSLIFKMGSTYKNKLKNLTTRGK
ncbi:MAG: HU family DNA-binding protein [Paludibacteraceae bacterium]|nr:HU family DNA-binding protein [Paludibacteraceae bacterium]